jgi:uncharacterized Zn finger protein
MSWSQWKPYVPVAQRRHKAAREMEKLRKKGLDLQPVTVAGRKIAKTFWGEAWCDHLESFSDYQNRLPRGRTYTRNGSVCHLGIEAGEVDAYVSGSEIYRLKISIQPLAKKKWTALRKRCTGQVSSLIDLIQGRLSADVMEAVTDRSKGLFPSPSEISFDCNCPDWAVMCKHVAAVLYGVGARLDQQPELLFKLRGVDHEDLIDTEAGIASATAGSKSTRNRLADDTLGDVFGIDLSESDSVPAKPAKPAKAKSAHSPRKKIASAKTKKVKQSASTKAKVASRKSSPTGEQVAAMRKRLGMSQSKFATLLEVSVPTVAKWEKAKGVLVLRPRNAKTLKAAIRMSKKKAWEQCQED